MTSRIQKTKKAKARIAVIFCLVTQMILSPNKTLEVKFSIDLILLKSNLKVVQITLNPVSKNLKFQALIKKRMQVT